MTPDALIVGGLILIVCALGFSAILVHLMRVDDDLDPPDWVNQAPRVVPPRPPTPHTTRLARGL